MSIYTFVVVSMFLLVFIFIGYFVVQKIKFWIRQKRSESEGLNPREIAARWRDIEKLAETHGEMSLKLAIMEADKLLDYALKSMAMAGNTLGERLKFAQYKYPSIRQVWSAHHIRNKIAHEPSFYLDRGIAKKALRDFHAALREIGAM